METFYYGAMVIKNVTIALLDMFNDMIVTKYDSSATVVETKNVPIQWGPIEKEHRDRLENHYFDTSGNEIGDRFYLTIPRMSLLMTGISYNPDRAYGVNEWRYWFLETLELSGSSIQNMFSDYQPTPYDLNFELHIRADRMDYFSQILENILPYFNPKLYLRVKEFSFLNVERDLPVKLDSVIPDIRDELNETEMRQCNATLSLTVEAFMYRPFTESGMIHIINSRYYIGGSAPSYNTSGNPVITSATSTSASVYQFSDYETSGAILSGGEPIPSMVPSVYSWSADDTSASGFITYTSATPYERL